MNIQLKKNYVAIKKDDDVAMTESGIYIPDVKDGSTLKSGVVVAIGPGIFENGKWVEPDCYLGDTILFSSHTHFYEWEDLLIMRSSDIIGVL